MYRGKNPHKRWELGPGCLTLVVEPGFKCPSLAVSRDPLVAASERAAPGPWSLPQGITVSDALCAAPGPGCVPLTSDS